MSIYPWRAGTKFGRVVGAEPIGVEPFGSVKSTAHVITENFALYPFAQGLA